MDEQNGSTTPPRTGMRGLIPQWAYRHLRACGALQIAGGCVAVAAGLICLAAGAYGWAAFWLVSSALALGFGYWYLTIARSASPRT